MGHKLVMFLLRGSTPLILTTFPKPVVENKQGEYNCNIKKNDIIAIICVTYCDFCDS